MAIPVTTLAATYFRLICPLHEDFSRLSMTGEGYGAEAEIVKVRQVAKIFRVSRKMAGGPFRGGYPHGEDGVASTHIPSDQGFSPCELAFRYRIFVGSRALVTLETACLCWRRTGHRSGDFPLDVVRCSRLR